MIYLAGKLLGGKATFEKIHTVAATATLPLIFFQIFIFINSLINENYNFTEPDNYLLSLLFWFINFRILIVGLSITQKYSFGFAIVNVIIPYAILATIALLTKGYLI